MPSPILGPFGNAYRLGKAAGIPAATIRSIIAGSEPRVLTAQRIVRAHNAAGHPSTVATLWPLPAEPAQ